MAQRIHEQLIKIVTYSARFRNKVIGWLSHEEKIEVLNYEKEVKHWHTGHSMWYVMYMIVMWTSVFMIGIFVLIYNVEDITKGGEALVASSGGIVMGLTAIYKIYKSVKQFKS